MFLETEKIRFRQIEEEDLPTLRDWRNDSELRKRMREYAPLNMLNQKNWFESLQDRKNIMFGIEARPQIVQLYPDCPETIKVTQPRLIGICGLVHIGWKNRCAETSLYIGENNFTKREYYRHVAYLLCEYAFRELGLHRFWSEVYLIDNVWIDMYQDWGFKVDGIVRDTYWWNGKWHNSALISMIEQEWEVMREGYL